MRYQAQSVLALALLWGALGESQAQLPSDFPQLSLQPNTSPAPGYLIGSLTASDVPGVSNYFAILDNNLNPILLSQTNSLGNLACNGLFAAGRPLPLQVVPRHHQQRGPPCTFSKMNRLMWWPPTRRETVTLRTIMTSKCCPMAMR